MTTHWNRFAGKLLALRLRKCRASWVRLSQKLLDREHKQRSYLVEAQEITADDVAVVYEYCKDANSAIIHQLKSVCQRATKLPWLLPANKKPTCRDITILHEIIMRGDLSMLRDILNKSQYPKKLLEYKIHSVWYGTALHTAVRLHYGYEKYYSRREPAVTAKAMVKLFLQFGADPKQQDYYDDDVYTVCTSTSSQFSDPIPECLRVLE